MVPLYAVCSTMSLIFKAQAVYIATFRDCYEAWVIYNFHARGNAEEEEGPGPIADPHVCPDEFRGEGFPPGERQLAGRGRQPGGGCQFPGARLGSRGKRGQRGRKGR